MEKRKRWLKWANTPLWSMPVSVIGFEQTIERLEREVQRLRAENVKLRAELALIAGKGQDDGA